MTRTVLVTGAARGIGAALARMFGAEGARVGVLDVDAEGAAAVAADIADGVALVASTNDEAAVAAALDTLGTPDVVVNNAGIVRFGPLVDLSVDDWRAVVDVNLTGTFVVSRAVAARLRAEGRPGCIVNVTSMNGVAPGPNAGAYGSTKAAIALLTQQMALEWGGDGIRANAVAPGLIDAGMSEPIYADRRHPSGPRGQRCRWAGWVPRPTSAERFDSLTSDDAAYVTGQNLLVDGGVTMAMIANLPRRRRWTPSAMAAEQRTPSAMAARTTSERGPAHRRLGPSGRRHDRTAGRPPGRAPGSTRR